MIEKILDKYYAKKLMEKVLNDLSLYYLDKKPIYTKYGIELDIKDKKYTEKHYKKVLIIPYLECFDVYINRYDDLIKAVKEIIEMRCKKWI